MNQGEFSRIMLIEQALSTKDNSGSDDVVKTIILVWERVNRQFSPLIGACGVNLIFARSIELNKTGFPWIGLTPYPVTARNVFASHAADLAQQTPAEALRAASALLNTFGELLDALIGARLTGVFMQLALASDR